MATSVNSSYNTHWKFTSPIPPDPMYEKYEDPQKSNRVVKLRNPIPGDQPADRKITSPKPRLRYDALTIARNHQGKDLAYLFNPSYQIIPIGVKPTEKENRDFNKENYRKIKEIQRANKEKQIESARQTPVKAVYKLNKYDHIQSKVSQRIQTPIAPRKPPGSPKMERSQSVNDIRDVEATSKKINNKTEERNQNLSRPGNNCDFESTSNKKKTLAEKRNRPGTPKMNRSQSVNDIRSIEATGKKINSTTKERNVNSSRTDKNCDCGSTTGRETSNKEQKNNQQKTILKPTNNQNLDRGKSVNHIARNRERAKSVKLKRSPSLSALDDLREKKENEIKSYKKGKIPNYLRNRQNEWKREEEERIANTPDPTIPPGHVLMADADRRETLEILKKSQLEMMNELQSLPVSRDTVRVKTRRVLLERKLQEVDTALKIFSRPRVFIKED